MFAAKSTLGLVLFTISARLAFAAPPACLLAAVNTQSDPANLPALCGKDSSDVQDQIKDLCGDNVEAALSAYRDVCKEAGKPVSTESSSIKSSSSQASKTKASETKTSETQASETQASKTGSSSAGSTSGSTTETKSSESASATSAPYPVTYTSTYYDNDCSCTKTTAFSSTGVVGSSGFVSATGGAASTGYTAPSGSSGVGSGSSATGSPILPSGTKAPGSSSTSSLYTGAASKHTSPFVAGCLAAIGLAMAL